MKEKLYIIKLLLFGNKFIIKKCNKYLANGIYKFDNDYSKIINFNNKKENIITFTGTTKKESHNIIKRICKKIILSKSAINKNNSEFNGTMIIVSSSRNQYKVFDFKKKYVLTIYKNKKDFFKKIDNYNKLKKIYLLPDISNIDSSLNIIVEDYIINEEINSEKLFLKIIEDYSRINLNVDNNNNIIIKNYNLNKNSFINDIYLKIKECNFDFCKVISHGDLWKSNIIFNDEKIYYIDLENVNEYSFFYDIFFFMFSEAYICNNYEIIEKYFDGKYDEEFKILFKKYNYNYKFYQKEKYFLYFIYEYICNKWSKLNKKNMKNNIEKLIEMFDKIEKHRSVGEKQNESSKFSS